MTPAARCALRPHVGRPRAVGRHAGTGGYRRFAWTARGRRPARVVRRRGRRARARPRRPTGRATSGRGGATPTARRRRRPGVARLPPGLRARRRRVRRPARRGLGARRASTRCATAGSPRPGRSARGASATRRAPGSASPAPGRGCSPARSTADRARGLTDARRRQHGRGAARGPGRDPAPLGRDDETLRRVGDVRRAARRAGPRPGRGSDRAVAVGTGDLAARALAHRAAGRGQPRGHHRAGRPARPDARPRLAPSSPPAAAATWHDALATCGKVVVAPNGVNAIPSRVTAWLDARGPRAAAVRAVVEEVAGVVQVHGGTVTEESWTDRTAFDAGLAQRLAARSARRGPRSAAGDGRRARRGDPGRSGRADGDAVRPQPDGDLALAGRARRARRLPGRGRGADRVAAELAGAEPAVTSEAVLGGARAPARRGRAGRDVRRRRRAGSPRSPPAPRRATRPGCPAPCCPGSPTRTRTPSTGRCAGGRTTRAAPSGPGATGCTPSPPGSTPTRTSHWPAPPSPSARSPVSPPSASSTTCTTRPDGRPYADPNAMGHALAQAAADAGIRLTLLDTCYLAADVRSAGRRSRASSGGSPTATWTPGRRASPRCATGRGCGSAWPRTRCGRCRGRRCRPSPRRRGGPAPARAPLRAARRERRLPRRARPHPDRPARRRGPARPRDDGGARHPSHRRRRRPARRQRHRPRACARPPRPTSPTASARPGHCATPAARSRWAATSTPSPTRSPRHAGWRCTSASRPGSAAASRPRTCSTRLTAHSALGRPDAGRLAVGARADLVAVRLDTPRTAGADPAQVMLAASAADVDTVVVDGRRRRQRRPARARRRRRAAAGGHRAAVGGAPLTRTSASLVTGIGELATHDPDLGGTVHDAAARRRGRAIAWVGPAGRAPAADRRIDVGGRAVVPGFVDSHTHLVFAGDRAGEFAARMRGRALRRRGDRLDRRRHPRRRRRRHCGPLLAGRIAELRAQGTTTVEIKSGYGLTVADEERALRLAAEVTAETTFLGAHVVPPERGDRRGRTSRWSSARCSPPARRTPAGSTSSASPRARTPSTATRPARCSRPAARRGWACGCTATSSAPDRGFALAVELGAASVDHCTYLTDADVDALAGGDTVATLLPGVEFSTRSPYPDARRLLRRRGAARARDGLQPGHLRVVVDAADDRAGRARDGPDPGRGPARRHRGRGAGAAPHGRRRASRPAAAPTSRSSTPRATCTCPTARASRSPARSTPGRADRPGVIAVVRRSLSPDDQCGPGAADRPGAMARVRGRIGAG